MKTKYILPLVALLLSPAIHAALITSVSADATRGGYVDLSWKGVVSNDYAGFIDITMDNVYNRFTFCADIATAISNTTYTSIVSSPSIINNGYRVAWLVENYAATITTKTNGEALQFAIWDIIHDNGDGLSAGNFRSTGTTTAAVVTQANSYLALSLGHVSSNAAVFKNTNVATGQPGQTLVSLVPTDGGPGSVPEPSSMIFGATGLLAIVVFRRRLTNFRGLPNG